MDDFRNNVLEEEPVADTSVSETAPPRVKPRSSSPIIASYRDLLRQAVSAMRHDLRRTLLTMAGMAWASHEVEQSR